MNMKGKMLGFFALSAISQMMAGSVVNLHEIPTRRRFVSTRDREPFDFKKFKWNDSKGRPKGCKCERLTFEFMKPYGSTRYAITVDVDVVYGTEKSKFKKSTQYYNEIDAFIRHEDMHTIKKHKDDIIIKEIPYPETA